MVDWEKDFTKGTWKKKKFTVVNPNTQERLAEVVASPTDFTRRSFTTKISKWHAQYPKDKDVAEHWYSRLTGGGLGSLLSKGDEKHIQIIKKRLK